MKRERKEAWMRILVAIVSGFILKFWGIAIVVVGVINWLIEIFSAKRNRRLANFCEPWNTEMYKYTRYLSSVSNKRPFPFSDVERISKFEK
ncbi:MAG: DUF4389 domain-containing protein [Candidatus Pacearchaeota archaeon]|jgi:hypothetical protein